MRSVQCSAHCLSEFQWLLLSAGHYHLPRIWQRRTSDWRGTGQSVKHHFLRQGTDYDCSQGEWFQRRIHFTE